MRPRLGIALAALALALALVGCATTSAPPPGPAGAPRGVPASPLPDTPVGTTGSGGQISTRGTPAVVDSGPSSEAIAVLGTIPEALRPEERVPPPAIPPLRPAAEPADSLDLEPGGDDEAQSSIPVPQPTEPLGDRPDARARLDSLLAATPPAAPPRPGTAPATAPPGSAPPARASSAGDTCWRVQVRAPEEADVARAIRDAAQSQLLVAMVVEPEKGLYKVRTRDCMSGAVADSLRRRAAAAGFTGAFRFAAPRR
jgi:hypothetical protein